MYQRYDLQGLHVEIIEALRDAYEASYEEKGEVEGSYKWQYKLGFQTHTHVCSLLQFVFNILCLANVSNQYISL